MSSFKTDLVNVVDMRLVLIRHRAEVLGTRVFIYSSTFLKYSYLYAYS